ncbi:MAG: hypothetical protein HQK87_05135 [Nitrospinae bacterium]|nr:hypothetical protein [Nitrospinota bacterium]
MLKKFFNSPLFVGLMAMAAVGVVYINVILPLIGDTRLPRSVREPLAALTGAVAESSPTLAALNPFDRSAAGWVETPGRDPFLPHPVPEGPTGPDGETEALPRAADLFTLAGTMIDPGARLASVNGRMVREGDQLHEYRIDRIEPGLVWLTGPRGAESISVAASTAKATKENR